MQLLLIRHSDAQSSAPSDEERPLTDEGHEKMRLVASLLPRLITELPQIFSSPFLRTIQTAEHLIPFYPNTQITEIELLSSGARPKQTLAWLETLPKETIAAIVGHEPDMGRLASYLLTGEKLSVFEFKKAALCLIECPNKPAAGEFFCRWFLPPSAIIQLIGVQPKKR